MIKEESFDLNGLDVLFSMLLSLIFIRNTVDLKNFTVVPGYFEKYCRLFFIGRFTE